MGEKRNKKVYKCPNCHRVRKYNPWLNIIMKVCHACQVKMEVVDDS